MILDAPGTDLWIARFVVDAVGWHEDEISTTYDWRGAWTYVRIDPNLRQGHTKWLPTPRT